MNRSSVLGTAAAIAMAFLLASCSENAADVASPGGIHAVAVAPQMLVTPGSNVLISQVYGGGGNTGAQYTNDFIELLNAGTATADVGGWSVQYASSGGSSWQITAIPSGVTIAPGHYYLIQEGAGAGSPAALPTADLAASIALSGTAGKVVLSSGSTAVVGACPTANVIDHVGYGSIACAADPLWTHTPTLSNSTAAVRKDDGCTNTNDNANDFVALAPIPRNSSNTKTCGVVAQPASVTLVPTTATIDAGTTITFIATALDAGNNPVATTFTWTSSNEAVATISAAGVATAAAEGTTTITVTTANGKTSTATLTVDAAAPPPATDVVISQIYGSGGNSGAAYANDFVELFNTTSAAVDIASWTVQYTSATGSTWGSNSVTLPAGAKIEAGQYYLVQLSSGGATGAALPLADASGSINMSGSAGKVLLARPGVVPTAACPTENGIVDHVYYGSSASCSNAGGLSATTAVLRANGGCSTGPTDFATGPVAPRNTSSSRNPCHPAAGDPVAVTVSPSPFTMQVGNTQPLTPSATDANGLAATTTYTWRSINTAVATVDASGVVTAIAVGDDSIYATSANGIVGGAKVTVTNAAAPASGIVITEILANPVGDEGTREWFEVYNAGTTDVDMQGWQIRSAKSDGPDEVHVIASSVVVPAGGFAVLGNSANTTLNDNVGVAYAYPTGVITLSNGSTTEWLALHTAEGVTADSVAYSPRVGSVVTNPTYLPVEGIAREVVDIAQDNSAMSSSNWRDATAGYGAGGDFGTPGYGAYGVAGPVTRLVIAPSPASVLINGTRAMSATAVDARGNISTASLTWTSSDPATASIDNSGVATGHVPGSVTITATAASGVSAQTTLVVVDPDAPATITLSTDLGLMPVGTESRLITGVKTVDGRSVFVPLTYTVSDPNVLAIDNYDGRMYVRGTGVGTAEVRGTATNGVFGTRSITIVSVDAPTTAVYHNHIEFGMPTDANPSDDIIVTHHGYIASYNASRGGPNWVSWDLNASSFGAESRCNCFSPDQSLPAGVYMVNDADYIGSGYDRGHMVQSDSRSSTLQENAATFYMTNILPQAAANNQHVWAGFENFLDTLAVHGSEVYTVAGGEYAAAPQTLNGAGIVAIPDYTWKIALVMPGGEGLSNVTSPQNVQLYVVRMPNLLTTAHADSTWQMYQTTVDAIEAATGYDFLAALPDNIERIVEANDHAPVAGITGTYAGVEGAAIQFAGTATDPDAGDALTYSWSFGDGSSASGDAPSHTYADNGTFTATLIVTDGFGAADTTSTTITVANAIPVVAAFNGGTVLEGETYSAAGSFTDSGADTWVATVSYGGAPIGLALAGQTFSLSHVFAAAGSYTVSVHVTDDDGDTGSSSAVVIVQNASQGAAALAVTISSMQNDGSIPAATAATLNKTLQKAAESLASKSNPSGVNQMGSFKNQVNAALNAGKISAATAAALNAAADRIIASAGQ